MRSRLILLSVLLVALPAGCSDPARAARQTIDRTTRALLQADAGARRVTRGALLRIASEEGTQRGQELRQAGCPSAAASQPVGAPAGCQEVAARAQARYYARCAAVTAAALKVDKAVGLVWGALALVVDVLGDLDAGFGDQATLQGKVAVLLGDALKAYSDALVAYTAFRDLQVSLDSAGGAR